MKKKTEWVFLYSIIFTYNIFIKTHI